MSTSNTPPNRLGQAAAPSTAINEQRVILANIVREPTLMMRAQLNTAIVEKYAAAMKGGAVFPPVEIMQIDQQLFLTGGFHRTAAAASNGDTTILAQVRFGTLEQAILAAARAGAHEGLARTNEDKRKVVEALLATEWGKAHSDRMVAETAGVSHTLVSDMRADGSTGNGCQLKTKRQGKDGKVRSHKQPVTLKSPPAAGSINEIIADTEASADAREATLALEAKQLANTCERADFSDTAPTTDASESDTSKPATTRDDARGLRSTTSLDIVAAWNEAPLPERARALSNIGAEPILELLPRDWLPAVERWVAETRTPASPSVVLIENGRDGYPELPACLVRQLN